jgi:hypothetical protein
VEPAGDQGFLQTVRVVGVRSTSRSSVRVRVGGEERTFTDGTEVTFPRNMGGPRTFTVDRVEFTGYGLDVPAADHLDYRGRDVKGAAVVWLGAAGPASLDSAYRRLLGSRGRYAIEEQGALATISPRAGSASTPRPAAIGRAASATPDFTTSQRFDRPVAPSITVSDDVLAFLFSRAPRSYAELKQRADARDTLEPFRLDDVSLTFVIDVDYTVVRTETTHNIVGIVRGSDPVFSQTYVAYGAHYDHVGYHQAEATGNGSRAPGAPGRVTPGAADDRIWNGADDDGSGTVALMAVARAFAEGPRPKRSLLFVWHAGEERGLLGSRYFVDYPMVPLDSVVAQLNADMIGRNRDDRPSEANTVYLVGSDRISSELHAISQDANRAVPQPLTLDYEMNDPSDAEQLYYRSDHYSYASKGIPVIFFTTGLHPDYHANTDHASRIEYDKLTRIAQLIYETGRRVADLDHAPVRDRLGPRAGKGSR